MAIAINGSGTVTGISVGGLPDGIVDAGTLASNSVETVKINDDAVTEPKTSLITNRPAFSAYTSTSFDIASSTWVKQLFQTEYFDTDSAYDTSTSTFTVPANMGGAYQINYQITVDDINDGTYITSRLYVNGSGIGNSQGGYTYSPANDKVITLNQSFVYELSAGDTVNVYAYHNSTGTQSSENEQNHFSIFRLGGVTT